MSGMSIFHKEVSPQEDKLMIILGVILIIAGFLLQIGILTTLGIILLVIGAVLWIMGSVGHPIAGRRYWY